MSGFGLYVHIPYCTSICPYCDFNAYVAPKAPWSDLQDALVREIESRAALFEGPLDSVYFGGGTPSLAPPALVGEVIAAAKKALGLKARAEITLEANPGTLTPAKLAALRAVGINRLSMGWQSTNDRILRVLGRGHSAQDSARAFAEARDSGFDAISLDLIFAVPGQTLALLQADLDTIVGLSPEHVSLYALTFKAGTPFERRRRRGTLTPVDENLEIDMMEQIDKALECAGYIHYEVSNYAKPGSKAVHNTIYWQGGQYLGIGPGAHSFLREGSCKGWRWESTRKPDRYIEAWRAHAPRERSIFLQGRTDATVTFVESLTAKQLRTERLMCGLRHMQGVPSHLLLSNGDDTSSEQKIKQALQLGWIELTRDQIVPTSRGFRHADALALLLM